MGIEDYLETEHNRYGRNIRQSMDLINECNMHFSRPIYHEFRYESKEQEKEEKEERRQRNINNMIVLNSLLSERLF